MTKNGLIQFLQEIEGNPEIVLSCDDEGNSFRKFGGEYSRGNKGDVLILYPTWEEIEIED
jgi:hypothetical protein